MAFFRFLLLNVNFFSPIHSCKIEKELCKKKRFNWEYWFFKAWRNLLWSGLAFYSLNSFRPLFFVVVYTSQWDQDASEFGLRCKPTSRHLFRNDHLCILEFQQYLLNRHLLRFFDCLAHLNLSATLATHQKWPFKVWILKEVPSEKCNSE